MQILRNTPATLELSVYQAGVLTNLDALPTLALADANGATVTSGAVSTPSTGIYRSVLPGQADLKTIKAVWTGALAGDIAAFTQRYEIVGNLLFTEAEARGARFTGQQAPLADELKYPDAVVADMRELIAYQFEEKTSHSWIRRYCRMELVGTGGRVLSLARGHARDVDGSRVGGGGWLRNVARIISATVGETVLDPADVKVDGWHLFLSDGLWSFTRTDPFNVVIEYEYGDDPVDFEARENGLRMVVSNLVPSDVPDYTQTISQSGYSTSFQQAEVLRGSLRVWPERTREWLERNRSVGVA